VKLDALLRAHGFMNVQRPPALWEADTEDIRFVPLLGEVIAVRASLTNALRLRAPASRTFAACRPTAP